MNFHRPTRVELFCRNQRERGELLTDARYGTGTTLIRENVLIQRLQGIGDRLDMMVVRVGVNVSLLYTGIVKAADGHTRH